jgi:hypothetical protein
MKRAALVVVIVASAQWVVAQRQSKSPLFQKQPWQRRFITSDSVVAKNRGSDTARYVGSSAAGDVYALPQDGMRCLKPSNSVTYAMPVKPLSERPISVIIHRDSAGKRINVYPPPANGQMPNAYSGKSLVWEKKP